MNGFEPKSTCNIIIKPDIASARTLTRNVSFIFGCENIKKKRNETIFRREETQREASGRLID